MLQLPATGGGGFDPGFYSGPRWGLAFPDTWVLPPTPTQTALVWSPLCVIQVCFSVSENTHMSVVGDGVFKMYRYLDGVLRQFAMQKADFPHFICHAWLSPDLVIGGTVNGRLIVMDSIDYKREYVVFPDIENHADVKSV